MVAWNIESDGGGTVTPSGGVADISGNVAAITAGLDADAAAATAVLTLTLPAAGAGAYTLTGKSAVTSAEAAPVITVPGNQVAKLGDAVPYSGTLLDQFGAALSGPGPFLLPIPLAPS